MREYGAHDLAHLAFNAPLALETQRLTQLPPNPGSDLHDTLRSTLAGNADDAAKSATDTWHSLRWIFRQPLPGPTYPKYLRREDRTNFDNEWYYIDKLSIPPPAPAPAPAQNSHSPSPTLLSVSQKIYDAETSRRESINTRCSTVLNTAGILGALVVAAGQLGLMLHARKLTGFTWPVLVFFLISLAYLGYSVIIALQVHGAIQGEVIDAYDLYADNPGQLQLDDYNLNVAKTQLLYAYYNWCMNNGFKYRLQSAQRALRNGVIAVIIAGGFSPWAITTTTALPRPTPVISSHATASVRLTSLTPFVKD
jgi:hypothetical protein